MNTLRKLLPVTLLPLSGVALQATIDWEGNTSRTASGLDTWAIAAAPFTAQAPTIDGVISPGEWDAADSFPLENVIHSTMDTAGLNASFRVMWDQTHLYILVEGTDAMGLDGVGSRLELYISTAYTRNFGVWQNSGYETGDFQILASLQPVSTGYELGLYSDKTPLLSWRRANQIEEGAFVSEIRISWSDLGGLPASRGLENSDYIGFELQFQRGTQNNNRAKLSWAGEMDTAWAATEDWGTLRLLAAGDVEPLPRTWAGYAVNDDGWADTGSFFGFLYVDFGAFVYSYLLDGFMFMPEGLVDDDGGWTYLFR